jgi:hypothetical protein
MRKIKLDNKIKSIDISDGKGRIPFGMNGVGGMKFVIDGRQIGDNCHCENSRMLDGKVNFRHKRETRNFSYYDIFTIDDENYKKLKKINSLSYEDIKQIDENERIKTVLFGLKYDSLFGFNDGYRFGREITFDNFCVCFSSRKIIVFGSNHNGFIKPDYICIDKEHSKFRSVFSLIKKRINEYFDF